MSKGKRKYRVKSFCRLDADLIESDAFRELSGKAALVVLIRFHQKAWRKQTSKHSKRPGAYIITNNGDLTFPYGEAAELGIRSSRTFHKVIRELVEQKGFVDISEPGNWYMKRPTRYSISERWKHYGTDEYRPVEIPRTLPHGLGFQAK